MKDRERKRREKLVQGIERKYVENAESACTNTNLRRAAGRSKNDEFYTQMSDIENELHRHREHLAGKIVYCNCDDPYTSNFFRVLGRDFDIFGLKKLITTHFVYSDMFVPGETYKLEVTEPVRLIVGDDLREEPGWDFSKTKKTILKENGDFRSEECIEILKECDIVITNPPFSLFREFLAQLIEYKKEFLIIGNKNAFAYKEVFKLIRDGKMRVGYTVPREFGTPDGEISTKQVGLTRWFTNLDIDKYAYELILSAYYSPEKYPKYDNFDAINVNQVAEIPRDYFGYMGVPLTYLDRHNPKQFDIIGVFADKREVSDGILQGSPVYIDERHKKYMGPALNGKAVYARIIIQQRPDNPFGKVDKK